MPSKSTAMVMLFCIFCWQGCEERDFANSRGNRRAQKIWNFGGQEQAQFGQGPAKVPNPALLAKRVFIRQLCTTD